MAIKTWLNPHNINRDRNQPIFRVDASEETIVEAATLFAALDAAYLAMFDARVAAREGRA